jgi:hypothetical protein
VARSLNEIAQQMQMPDNFAREKGSVHLALAVRTPPHEGRMAQQARALLESSKGGGVPSSMRDGLFRDVACVLPIMCADVAAF